MGDREYCNRQLFEDMAALLSSHKLPAWEDFPEIELYMDQVVILLSQYLNHLEIIFHESKPVTPAMINNYVKMKLIVAPQKKRYTRSHLACLIMICILKRSLNMSAIQKLLPMPMSEDEIRTAYEEFRRNRIIGIESFKAQMANWDGGVFGAEGEESETGQLIRLAVAANLYKISAERLVENGTKAEEKKK